MPAKLTPQEKAHRRKLLAFQRELRAAPIAKIHGITISASGGKSQGEKKWTFVLIVSPWQAEGSEIKTSDLVVRSYVDDAQMQHLCERFRGDGTFVLLRGRLVEKGVFDSPNALLVGAIEAVPSPPELAKVALAIKQASTRREPILGLLRFDQFLKTWRGTLKVSGRIVSLSVKGGVDATIDAHFDLARKVLEELPKWTRIAAARAAKDYLDLYNSNWRLDVDEPRLDSEQFVARLAIESISVDSALAGSICFDDGGLFGGHAIHVELDLQRAIAGRTELFG